MFKDGPEEFLGHLGRTHFVRMGKVVAGGGRGSPDAGQWTRLQAQGITNVVESDAMGELRVDQRHHMTPRTEGAGSFIHFCFTGNLGHQKLRKF